MSKARDPKAPDETTIKNIIINYSQNEKALINQLYFKVGHGTTIGGFREDIWKGMFEQIIPKKFVIEQSVFILDSAGRVSNEVDLAIFDETYTPYIFRYGRLKFIPIEAVAVVVECKSQSLKQNNLKNWAESIAALTTSLKSYTRTANRIIVGEDGANPTQTQTRPLRILCCLNEGVVNSFLDSKEKLFAIIIRASSPKKRLKIEFDLQKKYLREWYFTLNHAGCRQGKMEANDANNNSKKIDYGTNLGEEELISCQVEKENGSPISLLSFNLQLNQLLMLMNNPIPFPHLAYAEMFNQFAEGAGNDE